MINHNKFLSTFEENNNRKGSAPLWMMRQAGRYLAEYREIRQNQPNFLNFVYNSNAAAEVTLQPVTRYNLDAAILFSDILVIPDALGMDVTFVKGEGPKLGLLKTAADLEMLDINRIPTHLAPVAETVKKVRAELADDKALIGFCGAPWTVGAYMWDGHPSKETLNFRKLAYENPAAFTRQMDIMVAASLTYLNMQIEAGADAIMIFDSWAGLVPPALVDMALVQPNTKLIQALRAKYPTLPILYFPRNVSEENLLKLGQIKGLSGMGLSHTVNLKWACENLPNHLVLQGNFDPAILRTNPEKIKATVADMLAQVPPTRKYVCNLGHGIHLDTPPEHVGVFVEAVRAFYA